ncbi:SET domain-containing protein 5 [Pichia californica]|uniref:SET domain-containing protein 5 n=1 Tax=Pichia californica TaxID=460514 RepID=A0A9P7BH10_9ASCO|nr:SET domain-containing protein 5 [[Candida] californica]KAG0689419.1 SET domain-containing protein 5 [[Candida] californica]
MFQGEISTTFDKETLSQILKKIFSKSKSTHLLRLDTSSNEIKLKSDKPRLGLIYIEAPFITLPDFEVLKLIERGKCCSYCGEVLKIYDNGKMKDDGKKGNREKQTSIDKHERYINGLDCSNCEVRWCDKQCKGLDFKHNLLFHRPSNKSATHAFMSVDYIEKDTFFFDKWSKLKNYLVENNMKIIFNSIICLLHIYYDENLKSGYESLKCYDSNDESQLEIFIESWDILKVTDLKSIWEDFQSCFKKFKIEYIKFLKYIIIFRLNNYNGSIYLIFSALTKSHISDPNAKVEYYDGKTQHDYEEFSVQTDETKNVHIVKEVIVDSPSVRPIYTNKTSGMLDKKIIQVSNISKLPNNAQLILSDEDYSNPLDLDDDEIEIISDDESENKVPKLVLPLPLTPQQKNPKIRTASFTSSGASFGEGIIKYNRDQIREMLENMSHSNRLDEESSDETDDAIVLDDEVSSSFGSSVNKNLVAMVKNMQINNAAQQRRKSVKFEETVTTI